MEEQNEFSNRIIYELEYQSSLLETIARGARLYFWLTFVSLILSAAMGVGYVLLILRIFQR